MDVTIIAVEDAGNDLLQVTATYADPTLGEQTVTAFGWVSATTNHYDPADYDEDGNRAAGAKPRKMTAAEVGEYARQLVLEQYPELAAQPVATEATPIPFKAP